MENNRGSSELGVESQVGVELQVGVNRRHEVDRAEAETRKLLPSTSPVHSRTNSIRSYRATVSNNSSTSVVEPADKRKFSCRFICTNHFNTNADPQWMPFTLRWYFIIILAGYSITCVAVILVLHQYSHKSNGLCTEDSAIPGWTFIPTLVAVFYRQLIAMVFGAVKMTDPFARMSKASERTPVARYTILETTKPWWTTLAQGFQKRRNGGSWNWVMILSSSIYILAILGISPMSAALLRSKEVQQKSSEAVVQLTMPNGATLRPRSERNTYLQTMSAMFQGYSTSPWITDGFVILPFWPENPNDSGSPWDSRVSNSGTWEADTTIFHNDLVCTKLSMKKKDIYLRHAHDDQESRLEDTLYAAFVLLDSSHGCQLNVTVNVTRNIVEKDEPSLQFASTWVTWSDIDEIMLGDSYLRNATLRLNEDCQETEVIMMSTPWWYSPLTTTIDRFLENMTMLAYACHSEYSMATMPVRATSALGTLAVEFEEDLFQQMSTPIPSTISNLLALSKIYTDVEWSQFAPQRPSGPSDHVIVGGYAAMLGAAYDFDVSKMMADPDLPMIAALLRRRFVAEVVGGSFQSMKILEEHRTTGHRFEYVRKVLVSGQAASTICAMLLISSFSLLTVLWVSQAKRNLNIYQDPSTVLGISVWGSGNATTLSKFAKLDLAARKVLKEELADRTFYSRDGSLDEIEASIRVSHEEKTRSPSDDATPILPVLRLRNLALLSLYALCLLVGITVLHRYAQKSELYQDFFTYRANVKVLGRVNTISPFAIIPTLLAIIIALWWESVDTTCRMVQPYISMQHGAKRPSQGIALSYASSFWLFASFKALQNRNWLLSLITATTFLLQVLTIAMSALFNSGNSFLVSVSEVPQTLELRNLPFVRQVLLTTEQSLWKYDYNITGERSADEFGNIVADSLYELDTDWMYTAMLQTALKGSQPECVAVGTRKRGIALS
ncbi:DUF3433 domain containing protein, partial [Pyrenophora tritici-repentis]